MKTIFKVVLFAQLLLLYALSLAQEVESIQPKLLSYPESAVFDSTGNRYFVSSQGTGAIITIDEEGTQTTFASGYGIVIGLTISGDTLFAVCDNIVRGLLLQTGDLVFQHNVTTAVKLNDIVADGYGNLYVGDVLGNDIYFINTQNGSDSIFASTDLIGPNGIYLEPENNRLLVVSWKENSPLQSIDLSTGEVTTIIELGLSNCDGLTKDSSGNYYISEWETGSIHKYDSDFTFVEVVYTSQLAPADIYYNKYKNEIAIPLVYGHILDLLELPPITGLKKNISSKVLKLSCFPNPFKDNIYIQFECDDSFEIVITDMNGNVVKTFPLNDSSIINNQIVWDGKNNTGDRVKPGVYLCNLFTDNKSQSTCIILN